MGIILKKLFSTIQIVKVFQINMFETKTLRLMYSIHYENFTRYFILKFK